mmetsp:Transcript_113395/g.360507  ORF Transcript_113395/g.360507 Transcript_113395/m.360507 type:complete len:170 (+) Transcript_113395:1267-1776(+)
MFEVTPELVKASTFEERGTFDMVYDRGALESVPPSARESYVASTSRLLRQGGRMLLVVLDYDQAQVPIDPSGRRWSPPPFSMHEAEVRRLFPAQEWDVELLGKQVEANGLTAGNPSFHGVHVLEATYLLTKKSATYDPSSSSRGASRSYLLAGLASLGLVGAISSRCLA